MKYIIDIPEDAEYGILTCKVDRGYYTKDIDFAETEQLTAGYINEHFGDLQDTAYQKGFEDGVTKRTDGDACIGCKYKGNPNDNPCKCCSNGYPNQWAAKDDRIEIGDEVNWLGDYFIVTRIFQLRNMKEQCDGIDDDGCVYHDVLIKDLEKTGRHFDISKILEEMKA